MSTKALPVLVHGSRSVRVVETFKNRFCRFSEGSLRATSNSKSGARAAFAFPEVGVQYPDKAKDESFMKFSHVYIFNDVSALLEAFGSKEYEELEATYGQPEEHSDDLDSLNVYGGWKECSNAPDEIKRYMPSVNFNFYEVGAGFMRQHHVPRALEDSIIEAESDANPHSQLDPDRLGAFIGFTKRGIKPDQFEDLCFSFQRVCDQWYAKVPGIIGAFVCRDLQNANMVHDVRVFADHASYLAHVNKSDQELTSAIEKWFANYDTSIAFSGALYTPETDDPALSTSSVKDTKVQVTFRKYQYSEAAGMLGPKPYVATE